MMQLANLTIASDGSEDVFNIQLIYTSCRNMVAFNASVPVSLISHDRMETLVVGVEFYGFWDQRMF